MPPTVAAAPAARRRLWPYAVVVAVLATGAGGGGWALLGPSASSTSTADAGPVAVVTRGPLIVSVTESGEVTAEKRKVISNEIRWPVIIKSLVDEGEVVQKGEEIIVFECKELIDEIEKMGLAVTNAKNSYLQSVEAVELEKKEQDNLGRKALQAVEDAKADLRRYIEAAGPASISDANANITTARRDVALAQESLDFKEKVNEDPALNSPFSENEIEAERLRVDKLKFSLKKAITDHDMLIKYDNPRSIQNLKMAVEDAELALARAKHTAKSKLLTAENDRQTNRIALDMQTRQLDEMQEDANKLVITAEEEGLVVYDTGSNRYRPNDTVVEVGAKISPRQQLMIIPDMTTLLVKTKVYEAIIDQVKPGQRAYVRFDSRPDRVVPAHIVKVGVLPDSQHHWLNPGVKVFKVDVQLDEDVEDLKPGMTADTEIQLDRLTDVLSVPVAAVFTEQEMTYCCRVRDGQVERIEVKIGQMNETRVRILSGLEEGDKVLLTPPPSTGGKRDEEAEVDANAPAPAPEGMPERGARPAGPGKKRAGPGERPAKGKPAVPGGGQPRRGRPDGARRGGKADRPGR